MEIRRIRGWLARLLGLLNRKRREHEFAEELESHLDFHIADNIRAGMSPEEARRVALVKLGGVPQVQELHREQRGLPMLETLFHDLRFGARMLVKNPGFSVVVLLTLAFGIGVNTALFTVFNALALKPLPLKDADSFVIVLGVAQPGQRARRFSFPDYQDYAARNQSFSGLTLMSEVSATLGIEHSQSRDGQAQREEFGVVNCQLVAANYFSVLGAEMVLGRGFLPEEESAPNTHPVAVLSHYFWERSLNRDPQVIGRAIRLAGQLFTIVGVTNQEFIGTEFIRPVCWLPLMMREAFSPTEAGANWTTDRTLTGFNMFGRLKPGVAVAQAQAELSHLTAQLAQEHPNKRADEPRNAAMQLTRAPSFTANDNDDGDGLFPR